MARLGATVAALLLLALAAPPVSAAGAVNAFSLELIRLWTPETVAPSQQQSCAPAGDAKTRQRMQSWLARAAGHDPQAAMHQGALARLAESHLTVNGSGYEM